MSGYFVKRSFTVATETKSVCTSLILFLETDVHKYTVMLSNKIQCILLFIMCSFVHDLDLVNIC